MAAGAVGIFRRVIRLKERRERLAKLARVNGLGQFALGEGLVAEAVQRREDAHEFDRVEDVEWWLVGLALTLLTLHSLDSLDED